MDEEQIKEIYKLMLKNGADVLTIDYDQYVELHFEWKTVSYWPYDVGTEYVQTKLIAFTKIRR